MPGYKLYQDYRRFKNYLNVAGNPVRYVDKYVKREGEGHPLPAPPYKRRMPYRVYTGEVPHIGYEYAYGLLWPCVVSADTVPDWHPPTQTLINRVYGRMVKKVNGESSSLGIALAQWKQSWGMVMSRTATLLGAAQALGTGNLPKFAKKLKIRLKPKTVKKYWRPNRQRQLKRQREMERRKRVAKDAASLWLEYSFGWAPLAGDIFNAFTTLEEPLPIDSYYARARETAPIRWVGATSLQHFTYLEWRCDVALSNPNLYLANQLGLVNIGEVVFDAIPFSFVLDWFTKCQTWIRSWTDFIGLSVTNSTMVTRYRGSYLVRQWNRDSPDPGVTIISQFERKGGELRPLPIWSMDNVGATFKDDGDLNFRSLNAMSLLTQILSKY